MEYTYNVYNDIYYLMLAGKKDIEVRLLNEKSEKIFYKDIDELLLDNDIKRILPGSSKEDLVEILVKIFKEDFNNSKLVAFKFKYIESNFDA